MLYIYLKLTIIVLLLILIGYYGTKWFDKF